MNDGRGYAYLGDASAVAGEDEFALAPLVADAFVEGESSDAVGVVIAVADVLVEKYFTVERADDESGATG